MAHLGLSLNWSYARFKNTIVPLSQNKIVENIWKITKFSQEISNFLQIWAKWIEKRWLWLYETDKITSSFIKFMKAKPVIWNCPGSPCGLMGLSSFRQKIASNLPGITRFCIPFTGLLNSSNELQDFVFHCRAYKELHRIARSPHGICKIFYCGSTRGPSWCRNGSKYPFSNSLITSSINQLFGLLGLRRN